MASQTLSHVQYRYREQALIATLQNLIRQPSITPDDAGCSELVAEYLNQMGFTTQIFTLNGVTNLIAQKGHHRPTLAFLGHTDVVPPGNPETWLFPPFSATLNNGFIYGRGSVDMKSGIACMLNALTLYYADPESDHNASIMFLLTSDEEGPADYGTRSIVDYLKQSHIPVDACLVGEPTARRNGGDTVKIGRRGALSGTINIHGVSGHVAYPHQIDNPLHTAAAVIKSLTQLNWDEGSADFPGTSLQVTHIDSGSFTDNISPSDCRIEFNIRYSHLWCEQSLTEFICQAISSVCNQFEIHWQRPCESYFSSPETKTTKLLSIIEQAVIKKTGRYPTLSTSGGTSDGRFMASICNDVYELGVPNQRIHQVDERVAIEELVVMRDIYLETLKGFFNHPATEAF